MISNFSEVEKSLKRCLKEKVSITAATVVGFLIAGTAAFGAVTDVTVTTTTSGQVTIDAGKGATNVSEAANFISVAQYKELVESGDLSGLLTIKTNENGETVFAGVSDNLGKVTAKATTNGAITLLKTDAEHKSITSELTIEATGFDGSNKATAMEAAGEGHTVTNDGAITVGNYAVGMKANAGATAVNNVDKTITVEGTDGVGMLAVTAVDKTTTLTNNGKITVTEGIGMATGQLLDGAEAALINKGTIDVTDGVGIKVEGVGKVNVEAGTMTVADGKTGIKVEGAGTTTVTGGNIEIDGTGTGINAEGNVTLKDIAITLGDGGTGIDYNGGNSKATANISTKDLEVGTADTTGIAATMSAVDGSTLDITTGSISTGDSNATGIRITGNNLNSGATTAEVKTTLGATVGKGVAVNGAKHNDITVSLNDSSAKDNSKIEVSGTGVDIDGGEAEGTTTVNINQSNLQVANNGKLVNVANGTDGAVNIDVKQNVDLLNGADLIKTSASGEVNVTLNADGQKVADGSLVNVVAAGGTTTVDINKDITITGSGNIVKAGAIASGSLNVNLNVEGNTGLNVASEKTALDLSAEL